MSENELLDAWRRSARVAELGMKVGGVNRALCQLTGYAHTREAKTLERLSEFLRAHGAYAEAADWLRRALAAPASSVKDVPRGLIYRGLALAQEGMDDLEGLQETLSEWFELAGGDEAFRREYGRLCQKIPALMDPAEAHSTGAV